jgi:hypothetical protein
MVGAWAVGDKVGMDCIMGDILTPFITAAGEAQTTAQTPAQTA